MEKVYPLKQAAALFLPGWGVASLRTEIRKGRLRVHRIAGKFGVTESDIREMVEKCREDQKDPTFISESERDEIQHGSLSTERMRSARAAVNESLRTLKDVSKRT